MPKTEAYKKYVEQLKTGCFSYFEEDEIEDIVLDFEEEFHFKEAAEALNLGMKYHPDSILLKKLHILLLIDTGDFTQAEKLLRPYENDGTLQTLDLLFTLALRRKQYEKACNLYVNGVLHKNISTEYACEAFDKAWNEIPKDFLYSALLQLKELSADDAASLHKISILLMAMQEIEAAIDTDNASLDLDAYNLDAWKNIARGYFELEDKQRCVEACTYGLAIDDNDILLHFMRGYVHTELQDYKDAIKDLTFVRDVREGHIEQTFQSDLPIEEQQIQLDSTYELLAQCYQHISSTDKAIECWTEFSKRRPKDTNSRLQLALLNLEKGNIPHALDWVNTALKISPRKITLLSLKVTILVSMRRFEETLEVIGKMLKINPKSRTALLAKGELCIHLGREEEADEAYRKLLTLKPKDEISKKLIIAYFESRGESDLLKDFLDKYS